MLFLGRLELLPLLCFFWEVGVLTLLGTPGVAPGVLILVIVLALLGDLLELRLPLLSGVRPRLCVPLRWWCLTPLALLTLLALVSVLALLGVLALLWTLDLLLGCLEGAVFVLAPLVDLELLGLVTELGAVDGLVGTEELLGIADLVGFKEAGGLGGTVDVEAGDMPGFEDLVGGEGMVGAKGLVVLKIPVDMKDLVAVDNDLVAFPKPTA